MRRPAVVLLTFLLLAVPAVAATPKNGTFATAGIGHTAEGASFAVTKHGTRLSSLRVNLTGDCQVTGGGQSGRSPFSVELTKATWKIKKGRFSGKRSEDRPGGGHVDVTLRGHFTSRKRASITIDATDRGTILECHGAAPFVVKRVD